MAIPARVPFKYTSSLERSSGFYVGGRIMGVAEPDRCLWATFGPVGAA